MSNGQEDHSLTKYLIVAGGIMMLFFAMCIVGWVCYELWWFQTAAIAGAPACGKDAYWVQTMVINSSLFKRSLSILGGLAIMLTGMATSYAILRSAPLASTENRQITATIQNETTNQSPNDPGHESTTNHQLAISGGGMSVSIVSASPGLVAMVCGAAVVCFVIGSKDNIGSYGAGSYYMDPTSNKVYCLGYQPSTAKQSDQKDGKS